MNGIRYVLDTNAVISMINGNGKILKLTNNADFVGLSIISDIEFLSFIDISEKDRELVADFITEAEVIDLNIKNAELLNNITQLRSSYKIKLPDAFIAATTFYKHAILITNDKDFSRITSLKTLHY